MTVRWRAPPSHAEKITPAHPNASCGASRQSLRRNKHKTTKWAISCCRDWAMNVVVPFSAVECFRPHVAFFGCFYLDRRLYRDKVCLCLFLISSKSDSIWALRTIHRSQSQLSNYKCRSASLRIISACVLRAKLKNKQTRSLDNFIKWNGVVWEECAASKPRFPPPKHTLGQHQYTAAIFCVVTFSCERLIHLLVVEKSVVSTIGSDFCIVMNCVLEWPGCGERNNTDTASWTVGYWRVSGAAELAVALAVTEGMNHHKNVCVCIFFFLLPFYLRIHIHCTGNVRRIKPWPLAAFWK